MKWTEEMVPNGGLDETRSPQTIEPHKWTSAYDTEPLPDGVRRRRGSTAENAVALLDVAETFDGGTNSRELFDGTSEHVSQSFQNAGGLSVSRIAVRLRIFAGAPTGTLDVALYSNTAGQPNAALAGAGFANFSTLDTATVTSEYRWYYFTLALPVALTAATTYHVVVRHLTAPAIGTNTVSAQEVTTPSGYANGNVCFSTNGTVWTTVAAADLNFRVYSGASAITAIADYRLSDAATSRHLLWAGRELYKNVGGTMTSVSARERTSPVADANRLPSWGVGQDRFFLTHNVSSPDAFSKKFYVLNGVEYWENEGIAPPTATLTLTSPNAANPLPAATYYVDYYYWNNDIGHPSNRRYQGAVVVAASNEVVTIAGDIINIAGLPAATVRENDRATHIRIELREGGSSIFRLVKQITLGTTTTTITALDLPTTIEAEYNHFPPDRHAVKCVADSFQFIGNVTEIGTGIARPYRVMQSALNGVTPYYESYPATSFRDFGKGDGDYVTALFYVSPGVLVVGLKNSIYAVDTRRFLTSDKILVSKEVGIASHSSGIVVGGKLFFFSDSASNIGPYVWSPGEGEPKLLLGIDNTIKTLNVSRNKYASCAVLSPGDNRFQWWTLVSGQSQSEHETILVYDYLIGAWTIYKKPSTRHGNVLGIVETTGVDRIYLGGYDGVEYLQDSGTTDAGVVFTGQLTLGDIDFGEPHAEKRMRFIEAVTEQNTAGAINVTVVRDYGERSPVSTQINHGPLLGRGGTAMVWGAGTWATGTWGLAADVRRRSALRGRAESFQPTFSSPDPFHVKTIQFAWTRTGRT